MDVVDMIERIRELERRGAALEPGADERARLRGPVLAYAEDFLRGLPEAKAFESDASSARGLRAAPIGEEPAPIGRLLELVRDCVDRPGLNPASPGHLAYIPGGGIYPSALGDYLADVTNRYAGVRLGGPGAVEMENVCLDWMARLVGYPEGSAGNLASGGSIANLIAIVTAREAHGIRSADVPGACVYMTEHVHHCVDKALRIAGLGECTVRHVPLDDRYRMRPSALRGLVAEDRAAGRCPWMVIVSAGTTDVGAVDPLREVGAVAREEGLWCHVDAAYGGFFALVESCREKLSGMALSDSVVLDPHKGLFLPYGTGAVLVRDREAMRRAHRYHANYMQDATGGRDGDGRAPIDDSPADLSPELTKHFRGLRLWLPLKLHGVAPFRDCLEEKLLLARHFHREVARLGFETGPEPELSVCTYRWVPDGHEEEADAFNRALVREIHRDGRVFVSSTRLDGRFVLRLAVLVFRTHLDTIERTLEVLEEKVKGLLEAGPEAWSVSPATGTARREA